LHVRDTPHNRRHRAEDSVSPRPSGQITGGRRPGVETPGFYEAEYVKTRVKHFFSLSLVSFIPKFGNNFPPWL
jgi:hypothetical protein